MEVNCNNNGLEKLNLRPASPARSTNSIKSNTSPSGINNDGLSWPAIGSKTRSLETKDEKNARLNAMADSVTNLLKVN